MPDPIPLDTYRSAVVGLHGCKATHAESVRVEEDFQGQRVWEGYVHVFNLEGHASASVAYSWSYPIEGSEKRGFVAVLGGGKINSPVAAVRAGIVQQLKDQRAND